MSAKKIKNLKPNANLTSNLKNPTVSSAKLKKLMMKIYLKTFRRTKRELQMKSKLRSTELFIDLVN